MKLYACIISDRAGVNKEELAAIAGAFSCGIEMLEDGVLFDVSGLERIIGTPAQIEQSIIASLKNQNMPGNVALAATVDTAVLLARHKKGFNHTVAAPDEFQKLPLSELGIENDSISIFKELGIETVEQLRQIPESDLIDRYGRQFRDVIDIIEQKGHSILTPNVKDENVSWNFHLDFPMEDFEQLIFIVNHGLDNLFRKITHFGFSTEHLDISFKLTNKTSRSYEIKTSFPTLDKAFWLKLINLRVSLDPPETGILGVNVVSHFTKPRPSQCGLYAASRPEPESLLLTVGKLKKLVGKDNVGVPVLLNQRLDEPFKLDSDQLPSGRETLEIKPEPPVIAFNYFRPPARAEVMVRDGRLVYLKTRYFSGRVTEYSGVWRENSRWWGHFWKTQEWDIEIENGGVYRLCKNGQEWFVSGEYD